MVIDYNYVLTIVEKLHAERELTLEGVDFDPLLLQSVEEILYLLRRRLQVISMNWWWCSSIASHSHIYICPGLQRRNGDENYLMVAGEGGGSRVYKSGGGGEGRDN